MTGPTTFSERELPGGLLAVRPTAPRDNGQRTDGGTLAATKRLLLAYCCSVLTHAILARRASLLAPISGLRTDQSSLGCRSHNQFGGWMAAVGNHKLLQSIINHHPTLFFTTTTMTQSPPPPTPNRQQKKQGHRSHGGARPAAQSLALLRPPPAGAGGGPARLPPRPGRVLPRKRHPLGQGGAARADQECAWPCVGVAKGTVDGRVVCAPSRSIDRSIPDPHPQRIATPLSKQVDGQLRAMEELHGNDFQPPEGAYTHIHTQSIGKNGFSRRNLTPCYCCRSHHFFVTQSC